MEIPTVMIRPPERPPFPPFVQYAEAFPFLSDAECQAVIDYAESAKLAPGTIGNGGNDTHYEDASYRCVKLRVLQCVEDNLGWLFARVRERVDWTNQDYYRFDLHGLVEGMQYLRYDADATIPGHYKWHQDYGGGLSSHRKLSVTIQLSKPEDYTGCRLKMAAPEEFEIPTLARGTGVIFPSWQPHCVTPIQSGVRRALVAWVAGPQFR